MNSSNSEAMINRSCSRPDSPGFGGLYSKIPHWRAIAELVGESGRIYLVGGSLRNFLSGREVTDWDFVADGDVFGLCRALAEKTGSHFVVLDRERDIYRIIPHRSSPLHLDFALMRGDIEEDLYLRDFTINGMAFDMTRGEFIDPTGGCDDLKNRILRLCSPSAIIDDPLRILRAYRMMGDFSLTMDEGAKTCISSELHRLPAVAWERIRDEIFRILENSDSYSIIRRMHEDGVLEILFPELKPSVGMSQNRYHRYDVFNHSLHTLHELEKLINSGFSAFGPLSGFLSDYAEKVLSPGRRTEELMKLAALFHDVGKPRSRRVENDILYYVGHHRTGEAIWKKIGRRMKLSNREIRMGSLMIYNHLLPVQLPLIEDKTEAKIEIYRFFKDAGNAAPGVLLLSWADVEAGQGEALTEQMVEKHHAFSVYLADLYRSRDPLAFPPVFIDGSGIIALLNIEPGPLVGELLSALSMESAMGNITDEKQTARLAGKLYEKLKNKHLA